MDVDADLDQAINTDELSTDLSQLSAEIAVAHWGEHVNGGGDRVAWELARTLSNNSLFVGWRDKSIEPEDIEPEQLIEGPLSERALQRGGIARMAAHLFGWQIAEPLRDFDVLVTSGNEPLFYIPPTEQIWIAYVHHTNRKQSEQIDDVKECRVKPIKLALYYLIRVAFDHNTHKPDHFIANSELVKKRMVRYWGVDQEKISVVYPPVDTHEYSPDHAETKSYYLTLSRLDWHKDISGILHVFDEHSDKQLIVAGDGPKRDSLEAIASENVTFLGYVSEAKKKQLLSEAKAFVFNARNEDFGIAPVEAMAAGTPVLGVREGMTQFQIIDGKNGYRHDRNNNSGTSLIDTVRLFESEGVKWTPEEIASFADRFSVTQFRQRMREVVAETIDQATTIPDWYEQISRGDG